MIYVAENAHDNCIAGKNTKEKDKKMNKTWFMIKLVLRCLWVLVAITMFVFGLIFFIYETNFMGWITWGLCCSVCIIIYLMRLAIGQAIDGAEEGKNEYTARIVGNNIYFENHPVRGAICGFIGGLIGGVLVGPLLLIMVFIGHVQGLVQTFITMYKSKHM